MIVCILSGNFLSFWKCKQWFILTLVIRIMFIRITRVKNYSFIFSVPSKMRSRSFIGCPLKVTCITVNTVNIVVRGKRYRDSKTSCYFLRRHNRWGALLNMHVRNWPISNSHNSATAINNRFLLRRGNVYDDISIQ